MAILCGWGRGKHPEKGKLGTALGVGHVLALTATSSATAVLGSAQGITSRIPPVHLLEGSSLHQKPGLLRPHSTQNGPGCKWIIWCKLPCSSRII